VHRPRQEAGRGPIRSATPGGDGAEPGLLDLNGFGDRFPGGALVIGPSLPGRSTSSPAAPLIQNADINVFHLGPATRPRDYSPAAPWP